MQVNVGGEILGSGSKEKIDLRTYNRTSFDLSRKWMSTMSAGTLVPFLNLVAMPGDNWDIELIAKSYTHPTIGPLFDTYKLQLDVFQSEIKNYIGMLHMNTTKVGMDMKKVKLPTVWLNGKQPVQGDNLNNLQIGSSCIFRYLGVAGLGFGRREDGEPVLQLERRINAIPWLIYWDIYKNYYANKQTEVGAVIHNPLTPVEGTFEGAELINTDGGIQGTIPFYSGTGTVPPEILYNIQTDWRLSIQWNDGNEPFEISRITFLVGSELIPATELFTDWTFTEINANEYIIIGQGNYTNKPMIRPISYFTVDKSVEDSNNIEPKVQFFPLENLDKMRMELLKAVDNVEGYQIRKDTAFTPYSLPLKVVNAAGGKTWYALTSGQEGLGLKTYQSDKNQSWLSTEWLDGENGVNAVTKVAVDEEGFTIDSLNLMTKIYMMLNRVAVSGGTYEDYISVNYTNNRQRNQDNPIYYGGLSKEIEFDEVISTAESADAEQPLGTLAGRGTMGDKHKGGRIKIQTDVHSMITGIVSITPRIGYSQGNDWTINLMNMEDFHKPALDGIGFQDLDTGKLAYWEDTMELTYNNLETRSAGKQTAWLDYQTAVNECFGNFAEENEQMFMTLQRRYEVEWVDGKPRIKDLSPYIDPAKHNFTFAYTRRDAQNFWVQIYAKITKRGYMSGKQMPNV